MLVCIDSNVIIWGIKNHDTPNEFDMRKRAAAFFKWIDGGKHNVIVPTIVLAEILAPESMEKRIEYTNTIRKRFQIVPFDLRCSHVYAQLIADRHPELKDYRGAESIRKDKMKFDMAIIACAMANGAKRIYTNNTKDFIKYAAGGIEIKDLEPVYEQNELFEAAKGASPEPPMEPR